MKIAKILRWYDRDGEYIGPEDRMVHTKEGTYPLQEYADMHGIELPDAKKSKKTINKDVKEKHEDMERSHDSRDTEVDGDGDSESTE